MEVGGWMGVGGVTLIAYRGPRGVCVRERMADIVWGKGGLFGPRLV